jgi:hypothetical protein
MTCMEVRDRLAEHTLGTLPPSETRDVGRHLDWCAGCRKESEELLEGLAAVALSMPSAEPSLSLERRVVDRVQIATGRRGEHRPTSRRGLRVLAVAMLAVLIMAIGTVGWAVAQRNRVQDVNRSLLDKVGNLRGLVGNSAGSFQVTLLPSNADRAAQLDEGRAIIFSARNGAFILVDVFISEPTSGPYSFRLLDRTGKALSAGQLQKTTNGDLIFYESTGQDLSKGISLSVFDHMGRMLLTGLVRPGSAG